jgi:hypothetical protein
MNDVEISYVDKSDSVFCLIVNGKTISGHIVTNQTGDGIRIRKSYIVKVANLHNISSPFYLEARHINALVSKLEKHPYILT